MSIDMLQLLASEGFDLHVAVDLQGIVKLVYRPHDLFVLGKGRIE